MRPSDICFRLHGTLERKEVVASIEEIVSSLVGSEEPAIFEVDPGGSTLRLAASLGIDPEPFRTVAFGTGLVGRTAETGEAYVIGRSEPSAARPEEAHLTACIPLALGGRVVGAIAIFRMLPQKTSGLEPLDYELFELLGTHAATALYCSGLREAAPAASPSC